MTKRTFKTYFVLGEQSGDDLAASLFPVLKARLDANGYDFTPMGLAGDKLTRCGVSSLFDIEDIAVMGISAVVARLPKIIRRVKQTVADIVAAEPDLVLLIDSPEFTHAVARRVRKKRPNIKIINYICPSVWAWRSGRAAKMTAYIDHVLTILPFEKDVLKQLNGPSASYVGHPLARQVGALQPAPTSLTDLPLLLVLPGSRRGEVKRLMEPFGKTLEHLDNRGVRFKAVIPAVPHLRDEILNAIADWPVKPQVVSNSENDNMFGKAHAALAASGTVSLQLALHYVPMVLAYQLDPIARRLRFLITTWSAALPNLIGGWPIVPEYLNELVHPERMGRMLERLLQDTPERQAQIAGFKVVTDRMETTKGASELCVDAIFDVLDIQSL